MFKQRFVALSQLYLLWKNGDGSLLLGVLSLAYTTGDQDASTYIRNSVD